MLGVLKSCDNCLSVPAKVAALVRLGDLFEMTNSTKAR